MFMEIYEKNRQAGRLIKLRKCENEGVDKLGNSHSQTSFLFFDKIDYPIRLKSRIFLTKGLQKTNYLINILF